MRTTASLPPIVIGFHGKARSGKSEAAKLLVDCGFELVSFADPLKNMLLHCGFTREQLWGSEKEIVDPRYGVTPRHAMQTLGTEWGRNLINQDFWVKAWSAFIKDKTHVVVDDVRFENEAALIRSMNGLMIFVTRDIAETKSSILHSSEAGIDFNPNSDFHLENNSSIAALRFRLVGVIASARPDALWS